MAKGDSPFRYGDYWLDRGRNKAVSDKWCIAWYDEGARTVRYKSTRCSDVEAAKEVLKAHVTRAEIAKPQDDDANVYVAAEIIRYFDEHGVNTLGEQKNGVISSICRCFIGFLKQDEVTLTCTFADLRPPVWKRFIAWRRNPHSHSLKWKGKQYDHIMITFRPGYPTRRSSKTSRSSSPRYITPSRTNALPARRSQPKRS